MTIGERLEQFEDDERRVGDLRREMHERMERIRRGEAGFDGAARELLDELRRRERELEIERTAIDALVEEATDAVRARRPARPPVTARTRLE